MSDYRDYLNKTKLHNNTIRKRRRRRFMFGIVLSAVLIFGIVFGHESISGEFNCAGVGEVMDVISSAVSQIGDRKLPIYSVETSEFFRHLQIHWCVVWKLWILLNPIHNI